MSAVNVLDTLVEMIVNLEPLNMTATYIVLGCDGLRCPRYHFQFPDAIMVTYTPAEVRVSDFELSHFFSFSFRFLFFLVFRIVLYNIRQ